MIIKNLQSGFGLFKKMTHHSRNISNIHPREKCFENVKLWEVANRTSLLFTLSEAHGVLNKALNILTSNRINLTRIASRPSKIVKDNWRQVDFFIDFDGNL